MPLVNGGPDLVVTLEAVLRNDGVIEAAARVLPAHVNTVRYRLGRIEDLTGRDPRRTRSALEFQLALTRYRTSRLMVL